MYFQDHIRILRDIDAFNQKSVTPKRSWITQNYGHGAAQLDQLVADGLVEQTAYIQFRGHTLSITASGRETLAANRHRV